jgi:hypothetical protein
VAEQSTTARGILDLNRAIYVERTPVVKKKKDHLWNPLELAKSVLLGTTARSACGLVEKFDRDRLEVVEYFGTCAKCVAATAAEQPGETISTLKKRGWTATLEAAFTELATRPSWTMTFGTTTGTWRMPPAA